MSVRQARRGKVRMNQTRTPSLVASGHRHFWTHRDGPDGKFSICRCGEQREGVWYGDRRRSG